MKVTGFTTKVVSVPRESGPLGDGLASLASNFITLKLHTDEGVDGISYAGCRLKKLEIEDKTPKNSPSIDGFDLNSLEFRSL